MSNFATVIRELQLMYHAAARATDPAESFAHRDIAAALADEHGIPIAVTDAIARSAYTNDSNTPAQYCPPDERLPARLA